MAPKDPEFMAAFAGVVDTKTEEHGRLLQQLAQGDTTAFWPLWKCYEPTLSRRCLQWMGGNHADAEDALSGASLRAWQYVSTHAAEITNIKAWLLRLLYNHCMSMQKAHRTYLRYRQPMTEIQSVKTVSCTSVDMALEEAILRDEMRMYMRSRINALPRRLREPVLLYFFQDMRQQEIASYLHLTPANIRKRLQHARDLLRTQITPYLQGESGAGWQGETSMQEAVMLPPQTHEGFSSRVVAMRAVQMILANETERYVQLALDTRPARQQQKLATLRAYVRQHPTGWRKRRQLAELLYSMGQWQEATTVYRQVLLRQPRDLDIQLRLGQMLHLLHRDNEAIAAYEGALALTQQEAMQRHVEGCMAICRQDTDAAVRSFTAATTLAPHHVVHWHTLGLTYVQMDRPVEALRAFDQALQADTNDLVALTHSYKPLLTIGNYVEAQRRMERALELDSGHTLALARLITGRCRRRWVYGEQGVHTRALLRRAIQADWECPEVRECRAHYHIARGKWNTGLALLRDYISEHPTCPDGWYHYARWCWHLGASQNAAEAMLRAYALNPHDAMLCQAACDMLSAAGRRNEARSVLDDMLQQFPNHWSVCATAGRVLIEVFHDQELACAVSAHSPICQPDLAQAWFQHGRVLMLAGQHRAAITAFEQGWERLPDAAEADFAAPAALWLSASYGAIGQETKRQSWWKTAGQCTRNRMALHPALSRDGLGQELAALG